MYPNKLENNSLETETPGRIVVVDESQGTVKSRVNPESQIMVRSRVG
jgi:hypothetical protein